MEARRRVVIDSDPGRLAVDDFTIAKLAIEYFVGSDRLEVHREKAKALLDRIRIEEVFDGGTIDVDNPSGAILDRKKIGRAIWLDRVSTEMALERDSDWKDTGDGRIALDLADVVIRSIEEGR